MASQASSQLHFVLFPFLIQGHIIPMIDIARLLAKQGAFVTIVTTPKNAARFQNVIERGIQSGLPIQVIEFRFPCQEVGLPEGCENWDMLPSITLVPKFFSAVEMLQLPLENLFREIQPKPSCLISDMLFLGRFLLPALEATKKPFIWVVRAGDKTKELEEWLSEEKFEERIEGRGLLIRGWAPQVVILSHPTVGGFLTHCGWNSVLEAVSNGLPMVTWPFFADQFCNEKLVVQVLRIGVSIGAERPLHLADEVKKEAVEKAVNMLMDEGGEGDERRRRAKEYGEMAKRAIEEGGSSSLNIKLLIQDIMQRAK